jgi:hypothetical protein
MGADVSPGKSYYSVRTVSVTYLLDTELLCHFLRNAVFVSCQ